MKKLVLLLLFLPLTLFSQEVLLDHSYIEDDSNGFNVGDVITVKFNLLYEQNNPSPTYMFMDYKFNNKLLQLDQVIFYQGTQTWYYEYVGYDFIGTNGVDITKLTEQRQTGFNYIQTPDLSIVRFSIQDSQPLVEDETLVEFKFIVKDKANTGYTEYTNLTNLNWVDLRDNSTGYEYDVHSLTQNISLNEVRGGDAGSVTLNLNTPSQHPTDYIYQIKDEADNIVLEGYFDSNYQAIVNGLQNDITYTVDINVDNQTATWLDEVVTVSDAFTVFQQVVNTMDAPGGNQGYFQYSLQYLLGEVNNSGNITSDDSYIMLNHIMGNNISEWFTSQANGAYVYSGREANYGYATNEYYFGMNPFIKPTDEEKVFNFNVGLVGDVDFSHSATPVAQASTHANKNNTRTKTTENYNLDIITELVDGKVILEVNLDKAELAGLQFNIHYDTDILEFTDITFDTGNEMVNFSTPKGNKLYFGSIDTTGQVEVKQGTPYKLIFEPKIQLTNTSGLIYFDITDAVKLDGTKVILNIN
jgi:hypothetical protein